MELSVFFEDGDGIVIKKDTTAMVAKFAHPKNVCLKVGINLPSCTGSVDRRCSA